MIICQICGDQEGPWQFEDVHIDDTQKVLLICEKCSKQLKKIEKHSKCNRCSPIEKMGYICDDCERRNY